MTKMLYITTEIEYDCITKVITQYLQLIAMTETSADVFWPCGTE